MNSESMKECGSGVFAHSVAGKPTDCWQTLEAHSEGVANLAAQYGKSFGSENFCWLLGKVHDLGKCRRAFQSYLFHANGLEDRGDDSEHSHSGAAACWVNETIKGYGRFLAYPLAGHHAGLTDWNAAEIVGDAALSSRLDREMGVLGETAVKKWIDRFQENWSASNLGSPWRGFSSRDASFWIRMLYSCLVDADFLDTERFMDEHQAAYRYGFEQLPVLQDRFFAHLDALRSGASKTTVNAIRDRILSACEAAAELPRGLFSLTVPTGGGKTLSSTAFAFRHARKFDMKRIIYVIPYTSIIEQTADVLSGFVGRENILEHHCNLDPERETVRSRLASENWDAPLVVTTAVQFFESFYACRSGRCRKLHNVCDSVVVLDEAQLLPPNLLMPIAEVIHQLAAHYGCSIVLTTATQTSICESPPLKDDVVREIIPSDWNLYRELKRTVIQLPEQGAARKSWEEVADELRKHDQVLCVVNTRRDCRALFNLMPKGTIHLSASMCGEHRSRVIAEVRRKLKTGDVVRVVSTQLVEAGVDVDFPIVYRAFTGLPSIVQTAGRCNREGTASLGRVVVFMPPESAPVGSLRWYEDAFMNQLAAHPDLDLDSPDVFPEFFRYYYNAQQDLGTEFKNLLQKRGEAEKGIFQFRTAASKFNMIDSRGSVSVIVRFGENGRDIDSLKRVGPKREIMRKLQRYTVSLPRGTFMRMLEGGAFSEAYEDSGIFVQELDSVYDSVYGLDLGWKGLTIEDVII